jgi:hypothetical protein
MNEMKGKRKKATKKAKKAPDKPPLEVVKDDPPPADVDVKVPPSESEVRPLNPVQALQYKFAMLQEELVGEKKKNITLKRAMIAKEEEIVALRRENAAMRETVVSREEQDMFKASGALLQQLGVGKNDEVMIEGGRLFVAPKGTAKKRQNG